MAKEIVSVTVDGKTRQGIAEMGFKLSQFIEHSYKKHQELQDTIRDLREIAEKMRTEDVSKQRIQKFIAAMNTIPAEKKHNLLNDLAMAVLGLEISVQRTAEILQQINEKLKKCDEFEKNEEMREIDEKEAAERETLGDMPEFPD